MLLARLQILAPEARSVLLARAQPEGTVEPLAREVAAAAAQAGFAGRLARVPGSDDSRYGSAPSRLSGLPDAELTELQIDMKELRETERARAALHAGGGYTVVAGGSILDSPETLLLCRAVDVVVLVGYRAKTLRSDLEAARDAVERAGGRLAGAVFVD